MPDMDKTDPLGTGPIGRGSGRCQQTDASSAQGCMGNDWGWGRGRGYGRGRGRCGGGGFGQVALTPQEEAALLEKRISTMQARLTELQQSRSQD
jgi:Family of unknown function (DUF5320)